MTRFKTIGLGAVLAGGLLLAAPAGAAPLSVAPVGAVAAAAVETVAYGCGPGWAPNAWGHCRPIYRRYGYYGPRHHHYGYRHHVRPVIHVGPFGGGLSFY